MIICQLCTFLWHLGVSKSAGARSTATDKCHKNRGNSDISVNGIERYIFSA